MRWVAVVVALVACSSSSTMERPPDDPRTIAEALGVPNGDTVDGRAIISKQWASVEAQTAQCMRDEGFEYRPRPDPYSAPNPQDHLSYSSDVGFGVSTMWLPKSVLGPNLIGSSEGGDIEDIDPNASVIAHLSAVQAQAFSVALYGFEGTSDSPPPRTATARQIVGCAEWALEQATEFQRLVDFSNSHVDEMERLERRVQGDSTLVEARKKIPECMRDAGIVDWTTRDDYVNRIRKELARLDAEVAYPASAEELPTLSAAGKRGLAALQADELRTAETFETCSAHAAKVEAKVRRQIENDWVEQNQDAFNP
jgi:hypothetical protein